MAHRDFAAAQAEHTDEPITFVLGEHTFTCRRRMPAGHLLDLAAVEDDPAALVSYLQAAMSDDDWQRFDELVHDPDALGPDQPVDVALLGEIVSWIVEEQTGRPTSPPVRSVHGRSASGRSSKQPARRRSA